MRVRRRRRPARRTRGIAVREVDHGRGRASSGALLAEVDGDQVAERRLQLVARGGRRLARTVRAGHRERSGDGEHRERERVRRHPDADRRGVAAQLPRATRLGPRQHERERAGPAAPRRGSLARSSNARDARRGLDGADEHGQREIARSPLRVEQPRGGGRDRRARCRCRRRCRSGARSARPERAAAAASAIGSGLHGRRPRRSRSGRGRRGRARPGRPSRPAALDAAALTPRRPASRRSRPRARRPAAATPIASANSRSYDARCRRPAPARVGQHLGGQRRELVRLARTAGCSRPGRPTAERRRAAAPSRSPCEHLDVEPERCGVLPRERDGVAARGRSRGPGRPGARP